MDIYDIALAMTPRIGGHTAAYLINKFFSAEQIFSMSLDELTQGAQLNESIALSIVRREGFRAAEAELKHCIKNNITPIALVDPEYPSLLRETHDPPFILYLQGDKSVLTRNNISVVGTRKMSSYGQMAIDNIVSQLAERVHNLVIISGLAFGVDAAAHRAAMNNDLPTVAVLPNPLPGVVPASHSALARGIIDSGGALITELHSTSKAAGKAYIARNRIIAGMSAATIIAESSLKGGAMSTARIANGEGRLVAAIPGRILDQASLGCNKLIADRNAMMLNSADDLIRDLRWDDRLIERKSINGESEKESIFDGYTERQIAILRQFTNSDPVSTTELELGSELTFTQLMGLLVELELMGAIRALPGSRYVSLITKG